MGVEHMTAAGIALGAEGNWLTCFILDQEAVVGGEDEFIYADRLEVVPGGFDLLEPKLEGGGARISFSGIVDFFAVDDDQWGFFTASFEGFSGTVIDIG